MEPNHKVTFKEERSSNNRVLIDDITICGSGFTRESAEVLCRYVGSGGIWYNGVI